MEPENTMRIPPWKGKSSSKPSFSGSMLIFQGVMWMVLVQGIGFDKSALFFDTSRGFLTVAEKRVGLPKVTPELQPEKCSGAFFLFFFSQHN